MSIKNVKGCENNNSCVNMSKKCEIESVNCETIAATSQNKQNNHGDIKDNTKTAVKMTNGGEFHTAKTRLISSSDSGQGTTNDQLGCDDKSANSGQHSTSGCQSSGENSDSPPIRSRSTSSESQTAVVQQKLEVAQSKLNQEDVEALLEDSKEVKKPPSVGSESESRSRVSSWIKSCDESRQFFNHLDVKLYYMSTRGRQFVEEVLKRMNSTDRYKRRINYDPDQPAAGTEHDMEYKFYLDKMCVKKLIGSHGENSEMIRAANQVDFYVSKNEEENIDTEIVTVRGPWANVRQAVIDIRDMLYSVGKNIQITHINTAVDPNEFVLQNMHSNYARIRLNVLEPVKIIGATSTAVYMQNLGDFRHQYLMMMDAQINRVYGTEDGWYDIVESPPEHVPLPINDYSVVVAPDHKGVYYRGIVERSNIETGEADIWFLDWGGRCTVPMKKLYKLHNRFNNLPYFGLIGNLAGCYLERSDPTFGPRLIEFISRYMPVKAKAVYMDPNGQYSILLYGNSGDCINHLLIDQGWVNSYHYVIYQPFVEDDCVQMEYYNPDTKKIETFYTYTNAYCNGCPQNNGYGYEEGYEEPEWHRKQRYKGDRNDYRRNYRGTTGQTYDGRRKYLRERRGMYENAEHNDHDRSYRRPNYEKGYAKFSNGRSGEEIYAAPQPATAKGEGPQSHLNGKQLTSAPSSKNGEYATDHDSAKESSSSSHPERNGWIIVPSATAESQSSTKSSSTKAAPEAKATSKPVPSNAEPSNTEPCLGATAKEPSKPSSACGRKTPETVNENVASGQRDHSKPPMPTGSVWTSQNIAKSGVLRPKASDKETSKHHLPSKPASSASCDSCSSSASTCSPTKAPERQVTPKTSNVPAAPSSTHEVSRENRGETLEDKWTVVTSKKRKKGFKGRTDQ